MDTKLTPEPTGVVAELAGILADKEIDLSKEGRARYLARKVFMRRRIFGDPDLPILDAAECVQWVES